MLVDDLIVNPTVVFEEDSTEISNNKGVNITTDADRETTTDGVRFFANDGENPFLVFVKSQNGVSSNQAFYLMCRPSAKDFGVLLASDDGIGFTVGENGEPCYFLQYGNTTKPISTEMKIEQDSWYHILLAVDKEGGYQGVICKDGAVEEAAYFRIGPDETEGENRANQSWQLSLGFRGEATLEIKNYCFYSFDHFADPVQ